MTDEETAKVRTETLEEIAILLDNRIRALRGKEGFARVRLELASLARTIRGLKGD